MHIQLKGQAAIDSATEAMRSKTEIELFGLRFKVVAVNSGQTAISENVNGSAALLCLTSHQDLAKAAEEAVRADLDGIPF